MTEIQFPQILPTPQEAYHDAQYPYPTDEGLPVVRIPIAGPPPFNMLAYVRTTAFAVDFGWNDTDTFRRSVTFQTPLGLRGFDPNGDPVPVVHSSTGFLRMMQAKATVEFQFALDAIHPDSRFDDYGRWTVVADLADREEAGQYNSAMFELSSWVMFHEPAAVPGAPAPASPEVPASSLTTRAIQLLETYKRYLSSPLANVPVAAAELTHLSAQLAVPPAFADAVAPQQLALDALTAFTPTPERRLDHLLQLNEARHNLIVRLRDAQQFPPAVALATATVTGYRDYAAQSGANLAKVQRDLADLVKPLLVVGAPEQALGAARAALEILQRIVPEAGQELDHEISTAEAQHNVVARLLDNGLVDEAKDLAATTIQAYVDYAHRPGAQVSRAIEALEELNERVLAPAGLATLADQAQQAAVALHPALT